MKRFLAAASFATIAVCCLQTELLAQSWPDFPDMDPDNIHAIDRGPGGYLSWWKLGICTFIFFVWVKLADWLNRDAQLVGKRIGLSPELWNPFVVGLFLVGFIAVISIPFFIAGVAVYVLTCVIPIAIYVLVRNSRVRENEVVFTFGHLMRLMGHEPPLIEPVEEPEGEAEIEFEAAGDSKSAVATNLLNARQSPMFGAVKNMIFDAVSRRANMLVMDYTPQSVSIKMQVDGIFHQVPTLDRASGDAMLVALKSLANLNPAERRQRQAGSFKGRLEDHKFICEVLSQGVKTGERVVLKFPIAKKDISSLGELGMALDTRDRLIHCLNSPGLVIVSAMPGGGLTSTWQAAVLAADRMTRDWIGVIDHDETDSELENIENTRFDSREGNSIVEVLPSLLLKQPNGIVAPKLVSKESTDLLTVQATEEERTVLTRTHARSAADALLRVMSLSGDRKRFLKAVTAVTSQRLLRRLCDNCKQPAASNPQLIQRLGGDPRNPPVIYTHFQPPVPPPVDEKGVPIEIETCPACSGLGYIGLVGAFEVMVIDDTLRRGIAAQPDMATINKLAVGRGNRSLAQEGYRLVLAGITSIPEVQRVLKATQ